MDELRSKLDKPESELPSFAMAILPVIAPIVLISTASTFIAIQGKGLSVRDFSDPVALVNRLKTPSNPASQLVASRLSDATREQLTQHDAATPPPSSLLKSLAGDLTTIIRGEALFSAGLPPGVTMRGQTMKMSERDQQGDNRTRHNRLLLEDAFSDELRPTSGMNPTLYSFGVFWGNRNVAMLLGALFAIAVLLRQQKGLTLARIAELIEPPFATAGVIILITSAGGAFGIMLRSAGVGDAVQAVVAGKEVNLILLSWFIAAVIRIAQGSATVAMLTTAAMVYPIMTSAGLPFHPLYIFMAIGFGAITLSWMNDSGFWVVCKLSGMTEKETLKSWSVIVTVNGVAGLITCIVLAKLLPFAQ